MSMFKYTCPLPLLYWSELIQLACYLHYVPVHKNAKAVGNSWWYFVLQSLVFRIRFERILKIRGFFSIDIY